LGEFRFIYGLIVEPALSLLAVGISNHIPCGPVGAKSVGNNDIRTPIPFHSLAQEFKFGLAISLHSDEDFTNITQNRKNATSNGDGGRILMVAGARSHLYRTVLKWAAQVVQAEHS
jgi:hypothetical protein